MISIINDMEDVRIFFREVLAEGTNMHPDELFENYVNMETNEPSYSIKEAAVRNALLESCFEVCDREGADIYEVSMAEFLKYTGLDRYIPMPA